MLDRDGIIIEERKRQQRKECQICPIQMHGVCAGHTVMEFEMRIRKMAERFVIVLLIGLFGTMVGLFWRIGEMSDEIKRDANGRLSSMEAKMDSWSERIGIIQTKQEETHRRLITLDNHR